LGSNLAILDAFWDKVTKSEPKRSFSESYKLNTFLDSNEWDVDSHFGSPTIVAVAPQLEQLQPVLDEHRLYIITTWHSQS
jgi:hypothetical protein